jgi:hypothetical protein
MTCPRSRYDDRVGGIVLAQKLMPLRAAVDVPLVLGIVGLGIATVL